MIKLKIRDKYFLAGMIFVIIIRLINKQSFDIYDSFSIILGGAFVGLIAYWIFGKNKK